MQAATNDNRYFLATTAISDFWDISGELLLLGPWCITENNCRALSSITTYSIVPSPWTTAEKIRDAAQYSRSIYNTTLPVLAGQLNKLHGISHPDKYWRVILGPWLLHFIELVYERYSRIENAVGLFPGLFTYTLPKEACLPVSSDTYDFLALNGKANNDLYNLKLISLIARSLYPDKCVEHKTAYSFSVSREVVRDTLTKKLFYAAKMLKDIFNRSDVILSDMYKFDCSQILALESKLRPEKVCFKYFNAGNFGQGYGGYSKEQRGKIKFGDKTDRFQSLLGEIIPLCIPLCYVENFRKYKPEAAEADKKIVGSAVGWYFNEKFKFFAAECSLRGAQLAEFQHGGGYGMCLSVPEESTALEKDIFYSWGWADAANGKVKPLASPYLSRLKDSAAAGKGGCLFIGTDTHRYPCSFGNSLSTDGMQKYFDDKKAFFESLDRKAMLKIAYRPYPDPGSGEMEAVRRIVPGLMFSRAGALTDKIKESDLVIIDHLSTTFIEALTINTPCVLFWDHKVNVLRPEAEPYFDFLRSAGILYKTPREAAIKVEEIIDDPLGWWQQREVQNLKDRFCRQFALTSENWADAWRGEFRAFL